MEIFNKQQFYIEDVIHFPSLPYENRETWKGKIYCYNPQITFSEIPNEVSLTIPTICYSHCSIDCNSKFCWNENWKEEREELTINVLRNLLQEYDEGISCVTIMTSLNFVKLNELFEYCKKIRPNLKTALYIGKDWNELVNCKEFCEFKFRNLDYIKIGSYKKEFGGLNNKNCNQRFYKIIHQDIDVEKLFERNLFICENKLFWN